MSMGSQGATDKTDQSRSMVRNLKRGPSMTCVQVRARGGRKLQPNRRKSSPSVPVDKKTMLVMEANEISSYLQKDYVFEDQSGPVEDESLVKIKVTNRKLSISCVWTLDKLKERLVKMRKLMYARDSDGSLRRDESAFFDPTDDWVKEIVDQSNNAKSSSSAANGTAHVSVNKNTDDLDREPIKLPNGVVSSSSTEDQEDCRGLSQESSSCPELPAESEFLMTSPNSDLSDGPLPEKYLMSSGRFMHLVEGSKLPGRRKSAKGHLSARSLSNGHMGDHVTQPVNQSLPWSSAPQRSRDPPKAHAYVQVAIQPAVTSVLSVCKNLVNTTLNRLSANPKSECLVDKIMSNCESLKVTVINVLEAYTHAQVEGTTADFADSDGMRTTTMQLVASMELLVSHTSLLSSSFDILESTLILELASQIHSAVRQVASEIVAFLQGCENDMDSIAQDSAAKVMDVLFELVRYCGELALATEAQPTCLVDPQAESYEDLMSLKSCKEEDLIHMKPIVDIKQSFLTGCDTFVGKTLHATLNSVIECEHVTQSLRENSGRASKRSSATTQGRSTNFQSDNGSAFSAVPQKASSGIQEEVIKHVSIVVGTTQILLLKSQALQEQLNSSMRDEDQKTVNYFQHYYSRCQSLVFQLNTLSDSVSLLVQASESLTQDEDAGVLKKICRCAEMVQKVTARLTAALTADVTADKQRHSHSSDVASNFIAISLNLKPELSENWLLNSDQSKLISHAGNDVRVATHDLSELIRSKLGQQQCGSKVKRMLPATPGRPIMRSHSAKLSERRRISRNISLVDSDQGNVL